MATAAAGTGELQVVRVHLPVVDAKVAVDVVEGESFAEDIAEIEALMRRGKRLQRQYAQQLADARIDLGELPGADFILNAPESVGKSKSFGAPAHWSRRISLFSYSTAACRSRPSL